MVRQAAHQLDLGHVERGLLARVGGRAAADRRAVHREVPRGGHPRVGLPLADQHVHRRHDRQRPRREGLDASGAQRRAAAYSAAKYDGRPTRIIACLNQPGWLAYSKQRIASAIEAGVDAIFYDNCFHGCKCPLCREKFAAYTDALYGQPLAVPGAKTGDASRNVQGGRSSPATRPPASPAGRGPLLLPVVVGRHGPPPPVRRVAAARHPGLREHPPAAPHERRPQRHLQRRRHRARPARRRAPQQYRPLQVLLRRGRRAKTDPHRVRPADPRRPHGESHAAAKPNACGLRRGRVPGASRLSSRWVGPRN